MFGVVGVVRVGIFAVDWGLLMVLFLGNVGISARSARRRALLQGVRYERLMGFQCDLVGVVIDSRDWSGPIAECFWAVTCRVLPCASTLMRLLEVETYERPCAYLLAKISTSGWLLIVSFSYPEFPSNGSRVRLTIKVVLIFVASDG